MRQSSATKVDVDYIETLVYATEAQKRFVKGEKKDRTGLNYLPWTMQKFSLVYVTTIWIKIVVA